MLVNPAIYQTPSPSRIESNSVRDVSEKLEAAFLTELLKVSGFAKPRSEFGGGAGEDQFASFLLEAQAREIVRAGGLGLTAIFERELQGVKK